MDLRNKFIGKLRQVEDRIEGLEMVLKRGRGDVRIIYSVFQIIQIIISVDVSVLYK